MNHQFQTYGDNMKNGKKFDFVGHITYPYTDDTRSFFFKQNIKKKLKVVKVNGVKIANYHTNLGGSNEFAQFLDTLGYEVEDLKEDNPDSRCSIPSIKIHCNNKECRHFKETRGGVCWIHIKADVEKIGKHRSAEKQVVISYGARDMREITTKSECILWYVNDVLKLQGYADVYGKMEMC